MSLVWFVNKRIFINVPHRWQYAGWQIPFSIGESLTKLPNPCKENSIINSKGKQKEHIVKNDNGKDVSQKGFSGPSSDEKVTEQNPKQLVDEIVEYKCYQGRLMYKRTNDLNWRYAY